LLRSEINFALFSHRFASTENERRTLLQSVSPSPALFYLLKFVS
jgi:hypothetical protein